MRPLEWVLLAVVAAALLLPVVTGRRLKRGRMAALVGLALVAQPVVEGFRYQLIPLYLVAVGQIAGDVLREERRLRGYPRFRRGALSLVTLAAVSVLPLALPVPDLETPGGPFAVGTITVELVDADRQDPYPVEPQEEEEEDDEVVTDPRRIVAQVWYPAEPDPSVEPLAWTPDAEEVLPALSRRFGFPGFFLNHTEDVPAHARPDLTPLSGRFPVVVYSHGWSGFRTIAVDQMEELASRGFLVIAPDHTHAAVATVFDDGEVVPLDEAALPDEEEVEAEAYTEATELLVETFAGDVILILDRLGEGPDAEFGEVAAHADLDLVGVFGHSTGGGAAVRVCLLDERCDAVAGFDAWVEPLPDSVLAEELGVPSLFVRSDGWRGTPNDRLLRGIAERSPEDAWWMGIEGASHNDFVLPPRFSPVSDLLGVKGPIDADRVDWILDTYLVGFFDRYLYGTGGSVLEREPPADVQLERTP